MLLELGGTRCFLILVTDSEAVTGSLSWMKKDLSVLPLILLFYFIFFAFKVQVCAFTIWPNLCPRYSRIVDETLGDLAGVTRIEGEIVEYERSSSGNSSGLCCFVRTEY